MSPSPTFLTPATQRPSRPIRTGKPASRQHGKEFGLDSSRLAIAGDSVGGNMTAAVTLLVRERKGPAIIYQVLLYPVTDANMNASSYQELTGGLSDCKFSRLDASDQTAGLHFLPGAAPYAGAASGILWAWS